MPIQGLQGAGVAEGLPVPNHCQHRTCATTCYSASFPHFTLTLLFHLTACLSDSAQLLLYHPALFPQDPEIQLSPLSSQLPFLCARVPIP